MISKIVFCAVLLLSFAGCSINGSGLQPTANWQRFVPVNVETFGGGLALDTKTGQLCRTWNLKENFEVVKEAPLCKTLYDADAGKQ